MGRPGVGGAPRLSLRAARGLVVRRAEESDDAAEEEAGADGADSPINAAEALEWGQTKFAEVSTHPAPRPESRGCSLQPFQLRGSHVRSRRGVKRRLVTRSFAHGAHVSEFSASHTRLTSLSVSLLWCRARRETTNARWTCFVRCSRCPAAAPCATRAPFGRSGASCFHFRGCSGRAPAGCPVVRPVASGCHQLTQGASTLALVLRPPALALAPLAPIGGADTGRCARTERLAVGVGEHSCASEGEENAAVRAPHAADTACCHPTRMPATSTHVVSVS